MIKLSENKVSLCDLPFTIAALERLDKLIETYADEKLGSAFVKFDYISMDDTIQINRKIMVEALKKQRQIIVDGLEELGIEVDE